MSLLHIDHWWGDGMECGECSKATLKFVFFLGSIFKLVAFETMVGVSISEHWMFSGFK